MGPVCTLMVGRLDDWLKVVAEKKDIIADPAVFDWAGVAVMKKAYRIYRERGYRLRLLSRGVPQPPALERVHRRRRGHLAALRVAAALQRLGRDAWRTGWTRRWTRQIVDELDRKFADFRRAYDEDGLTPARSSTRSGRRCGRCGSSSRRSRTLTR